MAKKPSLGRQKIKIARIEKPNHRQVTFSKRRSGLFKKACELCTLCGVEIVIVVFSPASKVFSFGHPDVDSLVDRFLVTRGLNNQIIVSNNNNNSSSATNASVRDLNSQLTHVNNLMETEKERKDDLEAAAMATRGECWWEAPIDKLGRRELEHLAASLEDLKKSVVMQAKSINEPNAPAANVNQVVAANQVVPVNQVFNQDPMMNVGFDNGFANFAPQNGFGGFQ